MSRRIFERLLRALVVPLAAVLWLVALGSEAALTSEVTTNASLPELRAQLDAWLNQPRFNGALWSVKVASLTPGARFTSNMQTG